MITPKGAAVFSALAFLGTVAMLLLALLVASWGALRGNRWLAGRALLGGAGLLVLYLLVLGGTGIAGGTQVLAPGAEKYFCELDCHLAYRVTEVRPLADSGARGTRTWAVVLQTRFDERTISPRRGRDAPLSPKPRLEVLADSAGRRYAPAQAGDEVARRLGVISTPITRELRPGESYQTVFTFELPAGAVPSHLVLQDDDPVATLLIGNERSLFHAPVLLGLAVGE